jgi:RNA polymerase sigma factor (sigma-70 family)
MDMTSADEETLIEAARQGCEDAWRFLISRYAKLIWSATRKYNFSYADREDIVQDVFLRLIDAIKRYDPREAKLSTFITIIATRVCIDKLRKGDRETPTNPDDLPLLFARLYEQDHESQEKLAFLYRAFDNVLDADQRRVIGLFHLCGYEYQEIASIMDKDTDWVKNTLYRARLQLRQYLDHGA